VVSPGGASGWTVDVVLPGQIDWSAFDDGSVVGPGVVVGVGGAGSRFEWRSFGAVSPGGAPLTATTPIYVASVAKQFTATMLATLVLDGVVALDDSVARWVPEASRWWQAVTLRHLVTHSGGLVRRDVAEGDDLAAAHADRVAAIVSERPERRGGEEHRYSNDGYVLLAEIMRRASGVEFGDLVRDRLLDPAGMGDSHFVDVGGVGSVPGWADGRDRVEATVRSVGDGGLVSTVADLLAWSRWLPRQPVAALVLGARPVMANGLLAHDAWGLSIRMHHGQVVQSHGGSITGYLASTVRFPRLDTTFVALANTDQDSAGFRARVHELIDDVLGDRLQLDRPSFEHTHGLPLDQ
jgi:CubicO group peptidase (beta-lactamase class C family)